MARTYSDCRSGRIRKVGRIRNLSSPNQRKRNVDHTKNGEEFIFPVADGTGTIVRERLRISENPLQGGTKPQGEKISEENFKANWESLKRENQEMTQMPGVNFLIYPRRLHLSSSQ